MANYGYGYGGSPSQPYTAMQPQGSYPNQASGAGYNNQSQYGNQRPAVQQDFNVTGGYGNSNYGYGRQQDSGNVHNAQASYGQSSYVARDTAYDSSKQGYYPSSTQGSSTSFGYAAPSVKQPSYQPAAASPYSNSSQTSAVKQSYSYSSQAGNSASSTTGYTARGQPAQPSSWDAGYGNSSVAQTALPAEQQKNKAADPLQIQNAYETVVYSAATSFLQQQSQNSKPQWQRQQKPQFRLYGQRRAPFSHLPSRTEQLHYCETCKISCAGAQTYKEHLEGQKHKKKVASGSSKSTASLPPGCYRCELCGVTCTGADAYNAHVKGARHQKTLKLHQKLGKPIPESKGPPPSKADKAAGVVSATKVAGPKINFVGGTKLYTTNEGTKEEAMPCKEETTESNTTDADMEDVIEEEDEPIVGEEYVEAVTDGQGYTCTLCDCRFNDDVAKTAHLKGRRHRLNYKKKVQPSLRVDMKGSKRMSRAQDDRGKRSKDSEMIWRQRQHEQMHWEQQLRMREEELRRWEEEEYMKKVGEDRYWTRPDRQRPLEMENYENQQAGRNRSGMGPHGGYGPPPPTADDQLVMTKHASVYPSDEELKQVQDVVASTEKALKLVSDELAEQVNDEKATAESNDATAATEDTNATSEDAKAVPDDAKGSSEETTAPSEEGAAPQEENAIKPLMQQDVQLKRILKGVMRVGVLAKGLLLRRQLDVELVVLCTEEPTVHLLEKVIELLPSKLSDVSDDSFVVEKTDDHFIVKPTTEPACTVTVYLTSPVVRELESKATQELPEAIADKAASSTDVLAKEKCLEALASLRHAKWFQAKANGLQSCVIIIRVMRDLRNSVTAFAPISDWMIELLVEMALSSCRITLAPGAAFRRVLEAISSGIFLPGGSGLIDPCEKDIVDAAKFLKPQEREDITSAAQNALRLMAFRQLAEVLSIDSSEIASRPPKRRHDSESATEMDAKVQCKEPESPDATTIPLLGCTAKTE